MGQGALSKPAVQWWLALRTRTPPAELLVLASVGCSYSRPNTR